MIARKLFLFCILFIIIFVPELAKPQATKGQSMRMHSIKLSGKKTAISIKDTRPVVVFAGIKPYENSSSRCKQPLTF